MMKFKMDLHIHTPASKCYKGQKSDMEYFEILRSASEQNLDIIAITDHNTVAGYERLMQLKEDVNKKIGFLEAYQNESYRMKADYDDMAKKKKMFDNILILPGVEVTVNPGVHILVIGNVTDVDLLSDLLTEVGYSLEMRGSDCDNAIDIDIINFLKNPKLEGLIISAPHIDSKNGIFNEMDGHYRSSVMKNGIITSFSINSDKQKENIIRMLKTDPEYKRDKMPAFINCSDAHEASAVGNKYSFAEMKEKTYLDLASLFKCAEGEISDTDDSSIVDTIEKILEDNTAILVENSIENVDDIAKILCAALNEDESILIFGVDNDLRLTGVNNAEDCFENKLYKAFELIKSSACSLSLSAKSYKLGNGKYVFIITLEQSERCLWYLKKDIEVYHLNESKPQLSTIEDIERIVYNNVLKDLLQIEQKDEERLNQANIQMNSIKRRIDKVYTIKNIVNGGFPILRYCELNVCNGSILSEDDVKQIPENGSADGNTYYIFKNTIRLNDAILRFSCPTAFLSNEILEKVNIYSVKKDSIVIVKGGGTHYIPEDGQIFGINEDFLVLTPNNEGDFDMRLLLAWVKSSLFVWYICRKLDSIDLYLPSVLTNAIFPLKKIKKQKEIIDLVDKIIKVEYDFLNKYEANKAKLEFEDFRLLVDMITQHNNFIDIEAGKLDEYFFDIFEIGIEGKQWIGADLKAEGIYDNLKNIELSNGTMILGS